MTQIFSAMPKMYPTGLNDVSRRTVTNERVQIPTHLAKVYGYAQTGPTTDQLVVGASRTNTYGAASFLENGPYATHATILSNKINAKGNIQAFQRLKPKDAGPNASLRLYLDVLQTRVPVYQRNADGTLAKDVDGQNIPTGVTVAGGIQYKWIVRQIPQDAGGFGVGQQGAGTMQDGAVQSVLYPVMDLEAPFFGKYGNLAGLRMWSQTQNGVSPLDNRLIDNVGVYPFRMAVLRRADEQSTGKLLKTIAGAESVEVTFKPETSNPYTEAEMHPGDIFIDAYQDLKTRGVVPTYGPFGRVFVYDNYVKTVHTMAWNAEKAHLSEFSDIQGLDVEKERYLMNLVGCHSSQGVPYTAVQVITTGTDTVRMSENSVFYARGGSDGTMSEALFDELVREAVMEYANPNSELQSPILHPESIMYDSGFSLATKYAMCSIISLRKDTAVVLSTHDVLGKVLTAAEDSSLAQALRTQLQLYPESEIHGTHVVRGLVMGRSGKLLDSKYRKHLPLSIELASKAADYMGAANGRWKPGFSFDSMPLNEIQLFTDINVTFTPDSVRNRDWKNCLVWAESNTRETAFWPAIKTVYDDDTSVLNSFFTMMICVELEKVGLRSWIQFTGSDKRTRPVLKKDVEDFINNDVKDRFDGRALIIPEVFYTKADEQRGYSWSTRIKLGAANMMTANTMELQSYRREELEALTNTTA